MKLTMKNLVKLARCVIVKSIVALPIPPRLTLPHFLSSGVQCDLDNEGQNQLFFGFKCLMDFLFGACGSVYSIFGLYFGLPELLWISLDLYEYLETIWILRMVKLIICNGLLDLYVLDLMETNLCLTRLQHYCGILFSRLVFPKLFSAFENIFNY